MEITLGKILSLVIAATYVLLAIPSAGWGAIKVCRVDILWSLI